MSTKFRRVETYAGSQWFTAVTPVSEEVNISANPVESVLLVVNLSDKEDIVDDASNLIPYSQQKTLGFILYVTDFDIKEFRDIKTLKGLDKHLKDFIEYLKKSIALTERASMYIDLMFHLQEAYLRIKKSPTEKDLRDYTRKVFKALQEVGPVVTYVAFGDTVPENSGLTPGWAFVDFLNEELLGE